MKVTMNKCKCGRFFEDDKEYKKHLEIHKAITIIDDSFPKVEDENCEFANGAWNVQRNESWLARYKRVIVGAIKTVGDADGNPFTYSWFRQLDDGGSMFYSYACRTLNICPKCLREWGQAYCANNCNCKDKAKT